eukprot:SAG22_NODE_13524_length_403_cov_1.226974_1_plen_58_part_10
MNKAIVNTDILLYHKKHPVTTNALVTLKKSNAQLHLPKLEERPTPSTMPERCVGSYPK